MPAQHSSSPPANLLMPPQSLALRPSPLPEALDGLRMVWLRIVERKGSPVVALMPGVEVLYPGVLDDPRVADTADKRIPDMVDHDSVTPAVVDIAMVEGPVVVKTHGNVSVAPPPAPTRPLPSHGNAAGGMTGW